MLVLEMPREAWMLAAMFIFMGAKMMQRSGELFARGRDWHGVTLLSAVLLLGPLFAIGLSILFQNAPRP